MPFDERISTLVAQHGRVSKKRGEKHRTSWRRFRDLTNSTFGPVFDEATNHHEMVLHSIGLDQMADDDKGIATSIALTAKGGRLALAYRVDLDHGCLHRSVEVERSAVCERPLTFDSTDRARVEADVVAFLRFALGLSTEQDIQAELGTPSRASGCSPIPADDSNR